MNGFIFQGDLTAKGVVEEIGFGGYLYIQGGFLEDFLIQGYGGDVFVDLRDGERGNKAKIF